MKDRWTDIAHWWLLSSFHGCKIHYLNEILFRIWQLFLTLKTLMLTVRRGLIFTGETRCLKSCSTPLQFVMTARDSNGNWKDLPGITWISLKLLKQENPLYLVQIQLKLKHRIYIHWNVFAFNLMFIKHMVSTCI